MEGTPPPMKFIGDVLSPGEVGALALVLLIFRVMTLRA